MTKKKIIIWLFSLIAGGDLTVSLTDGSLATLEGIQLQLAANLVGQNVQISGIDAASINNITLQVGIPWFFWLIRALILAEASCAQTPLCWQSCTDFTMALLRYRTEFPAFLRIRVVVGQNWKNVCTCVCAHAWVHWKENCRPLSLACLWNCIQIATCLKLILCFLLFYFFKWTLFFNLHLSIQEKLPLSVQETCFYLCFCI